MPALRQASPPCCRNARAAEGNAFGSIGSSLAIEGTRRYG